jgi:hypothetical protein
LKHPQGKSKTHQIRLAKTDSNTVCSLVRNVDKASDHKIEKALPRGERIQGVKLSLSGRRNRYLPNGLHGLQHLMYPYFQHLPFTSRFDFQRPSPPCTRPFYLLSALMPPLKQPHSLGLTSSSRPIRDKSWTPLFMDSFVYDPLSTWVAVSSMK